MKVPVKMFDEIVREVNHEVLPALKSEYDHIQQVGYMYGHWKEICIKLQDMTKHPTERYKKFPLIIVLEDLPVDCGDQLETTTLQILILNHTSNLYDSIERQAKIFDLVLYPIYQELLKQIAKSSFFTQIHPSKIKHRRIDRKFFGREEIYGNAANIPYEYVDAVQMQNVQLTINKQYCN